MRKPYLDSAGREVEDLEFEGRGVDRYIAKASYVDDGSDVPSEELERLAWGDCLCWACMECA